MKIEQIQPAHLKFYDNNTRTHSREQVEQIATSIELYGFNNPILIDPYNLIIAGHGRAMAGEQLGLEAVPCIRLGHLDETQRRAFAIADNKIAENAGWDEEKLKEELEAILTASGNLESLGFSPADLEAMLQPGNDEEEKRQEARKTLTDEFIFGPFSVLNARETRWLERKKAWINLGIESEAGRDEKLIFATSSQPPQAYTEKNQLEEELGRELTWPEFAELRPDAIRMKGTSIFDPVITEIAYSWFSPAGGTILDPFAGGSVRGVVAALLGYNYHGHELREEQVDANRLQWEGMNHLEPLKPNQPPGSAAWITGDSRETLADAPEADFLFSCPPYADLEVYSEDPKDISTMEYEDFLPAYREIIAKACAKLKEDRFAAFVVGDIRDKKGIYRNFIGHTIDAFTAAGLKYYNEAVLITPLASLAIRVGRFFRPMRKLGKAHQNMLIFKKESLDLKDLAEMKPTPDNPAMLPDHEKLLVFAKGDPRKASEAAGEVQGANLAVEEAEADKAVENLENGD